MTAHLRTRDWIQLLERLRRKEIPVPEIGSVIVKLGKPFDQARILAAKEVVADYLAHEDSWVRHEAMWFLTSWGRLVEYQPAIIYAVRNDSEVDNRMYAASCLGILQEGRKDPEAIAALRLALADSQEDELVRKYAYRSLLQVVRGQGDDFSPHENKLSDIDWDWVESVSSLA